MKVMNAAFLVGLALAAQVAAAEISSPIEKILSAKSGGKLRVDTDLGSIEVRSHAADQVLVRVERIVRTNDKEDARGVLERFKLAFSESGGSVSIRGDYDREDGFLGFLKDPQLNVKYIIQVPHSYNVQLDTSGGHIKVHGLKGNVNADTSGGHLEFGSIQGTINGHTSGGHITITKSSGKAEVETSGGHIRIGEVEGPVDAETSGGSITITRARGDVRADTSGGSITIDEIFGTVNARTSGGSIEARLSSQPRGNSSLETSGGSVVVYLPTNIGLDLDAETSGGRVVSALPVTVKGEMEKGSLRGSLNGGGPRLVLRSSGGNIRVEKRAAN